MQPKHVTISSAATLFQSVDSLAAGELEILLSGEPEWGNEVFQVKDSRVFSIMCELIKMVLKRVEFTAEKVMESCDGPL
jgi:hypothetical protein